MMTYEELVQTALDCGLTKAAVVDVDQIELNAEYRRICEGNSCGGYGSCYACPPCRSRASRSIKKQVQKRKRLYLFSFMFNRRGRPS